MLAPEEIADPTARALQEKHLSELRTLGEQFVAHKYPFAFYLSQTLDLEQARQREADQRSLRFDSYANQIALEVTGNYYASYAASRMTGNQRARQTFNDVMLPMLKAAVPMFKDEPGFQLFALEISHHVRKDVMNVSSESAENFVLVLPRVAAQELVTASTPDQMQDALLSSDAFLDGEQFNLWLSDEKTAPPVTARHIKKEKGKVTAEAAPALPTSADPPVSEDLSAPSRGSARLITPHDLDLLKTEHQDNIAAFTHELDDQAHFVSYAPPAFVAFHEGSYLQLSMMTGLEKPASSSNYYLAAQAFDTHIAHLIRPVLSYFPQDPDFDGIVFSTIVKVPGSESSEAVEFFLPFRAMRCFSRFDCTGQQLLNAGFVLINGERAGLNLQTAEAVSK